MPPVTEDAILVFVGSVASDDAAGTEARLFALEVDGDIVEVFEPADEVETSVSMTTTSGIGLFSPNFAVLEDDLYFAYASTDFQFGTAISFSTGIGRINVDGTVDASVATIENTGLAAVTYGDMTEVVGDALYFSLVPLSSGTEGIFSELFSLDSHGDVTQVTNLFRPGALGVQAGNAHLGDELYFIADQRSPLGPTELWRLNPDGTTEFLYVDNDATVTSVTEYGGNIYFMARFPPSIGDVVVFEVALGGQPEQIPFPPDGTFIGNGRLFTLADGLYFMGSREIYKLGEDGIFGDNLLDQSNPEFDLGGLQEIIVFNDTLYAVGSKKNPTNALVEDFLYRVNADGSTTQVLEIGQGINQNSFVQQLTIANGNLYFTARASFDDGFGGFLSAPALYQMDADENVTQLTLDRSIDGFGSLIAFTTDADLFVPGSEPVLMLPSQPIQISENNTGVAFEVSATDPDGGAVSLSLSGQDAALFALAGGQITFLQPPDFENPNDVNGDNFYEVTIMAEDSQGEISSATAIIEIIDVEEGATASGQIIVGTDGPDTLVGTANEDTIAGGLGDDSLSGGDGSDNISGSDGNDTLSGGTGGDNIGGGPGDDIIGGDAGNDVIGAGQGNDSADGGVGNDGVYGGAGTDTLVGGDGNDTLGAGFGDDRVDGGAGNDSLGGGTGKDLLSGSTGLDTMGGGEGDDTVNGGAGNDFLAGGGRNDVIDGGAGNDTINGGDGDDTMTGGEGADVFVWNFFKDGDQDVITDFEDGIDSFRMVGVENVPGSGLAGKVAALNITDVAGGALIDYQGHTVLIEGVAAADLTVDDFTFL